MKLLRYAGATSEIWQIFIANSSSTTGAGLTGLVFNSGSLTAYYHRDTDTSSTVINLVTMTVGTFTSSGFKEIDSTNMPGWYQFCPPNAALQPGAKSCVFHLQGASNMAPLAIEVQLADEAFGVIDSGTLQAATATTAQIRSGASFANSRLNGMTLQIIAGTGVGQSRVITAYTQSTTTATVDTWTTTPDSTSVYIIFGTAGASAVVPPAVNVLQWNSAAVAVPTAAGIPTVDGSVAQGAHAYPASYGGKTFDQMMEMIVAAVAGVTSGGGSVSETFKSPDGSTTVLVITNNGTNRTAVTMTPP